MKISLPPVFDKWLNSFSNGMLLLFPYMIVLSYLFLGIESMTYSGFLRKSFFFTSTIFSSLTIFIGLFLLLRSFLELKKSQELNLVFLVNRLFLPMTAFLYYLFYLEEKGHFPNFVFSQYHLNPEQFKYIVMFNFSVLVLDFFRFHREKVISFFERNRKNQNLESYIFVVVAIQFLFITLPTIISVTKTAVFDTSYIVTHFTDSYDQRQTKALSDYPYFAFIRDHTPEDAVIAIPPQQPPWLTSGNEGYVRYFLFPRTIVKNPDQNIVDPRANFVIIDKGEWAIPNPDGYGWPKATVSAERIWYFDRATRQTIESTDTVFDPTNPQQKLLWGLIKVRK